MGMTCLKVRFSLDPEVSFFACADVYVRRKEVVSIYLFPSLSLGRILYGCRCPLGFQYELICSRHTHMHKRPMPTSILT